jgi:hypothetical protein
MARLVPCSACEELVMVKTCVCPHCGAGGVCRTLSLPAAALLLGLAMTGCDDGGGEQVQPDYGVAITDNDGDGWGVEDGDCDDEDETIHPDADETPGDGIDSNCDGEDDT